MHRRTPQAQLAAAQARLAEQGGDDGLGPELQEGPPAAPRDLGGGAPLEISREQLAAAVAAARPSVTASERERLAGVYAQFLGGRVPGGGEGARQDPDGRPRPPPQVKRATLA